jgi:hypothetical protein
MRLSRVLPCALVLATIMSHTAAAQGGRQFRDAWFWGVKAGGLGYSQVDASGTGTPGYGQAPMLGVEWLITRTHGGLYTSFSQAFLSQQTLIVNSDDETDTTTRVVDLKNVRRIDMALMAFPGSHLKFHPYVGLGFSFSTMGTAAPQGPYATPEEQLFAESLVQEIKAAISPLVVVGSQVRARQASFFAQATVGPASRDWILYNGRSMNFSYEIGMRYNIGTSIER